MLRRLSNRLKAKVLNYFIKDVFRGISSEDILVVGKDGKMYRARREVDPEYAQKLQEQAERFIKSKLWEELNRVCEYKAYEQGTKKSTSFDATLFGKAMLFELDEIHKSLKQISGSSYKKRK